jgi:hypothetical protein
MLRKIAPRVTVRMLEVMDRLRSRSRQLRLIYERVSDVLRFGTRMLSHGSSDMPIWGPIFGSMDKYDEVAVRKRIKDLSDYLASLQQKES